MTQVSQVMTRGVRTLSPNDTLLLAAQAMEELNVGSVPVCDDGRLVGMVTDRDITVRGVAQGHVPDRTPLSEVMSENVRTCSENQPIEEVMEQMRDVQIRRMPVVDKDQHVVGILTLGDLAAKVRSAEVSHTLEDISQPAEPDRSGISQASGSAGGGSASGQASRH